MLLPNNPDIDTNALNERVQARLDQYALKKIDDPCGFSDDANYPSAPEELTAEESFDYTSVPLIALHDQEFIEQAYLQILGREVDADGLDHYLGQLRGGEDKRKLLMKLRYSDEGRQQGGQINVGANLRFTYWKEKLLRVPLLGKCFALVTVWLGASNFRRYENAQFNHFHRLNTQWSGLFEGQQRQLAGLQEQIDIQRADQEARLHLVKTRLVQTQQQLAVQQTEHNTAFAVVNAQLSKSEEGLSQLRLRLNSLERAPVAVPQAANEAPVVAGGLEVTVEVPVEDAFYAAFEEHFRGSAETIRQRLEYYLPVLDRCELLKNGAKVADIGCGRGEWLNLLGDQGYERFGIDLNFHNVESCLAAGHDAVLGDGLQWLQNQAPESLGAISSFHVIEHLTFAQLNLFLVEALRVLKPGGMIILETPNPENLVTGATHFYTDPTHLHPLPPAFTDFMLNYRGFTSTEIHRLNPIPAEYALLESTEVERRCNQLFYGPQDYAVVAFKSR